MFSRIAPDSRRWAHHLLPAMLLFWPYKASHRVFIIVFTFFSHFVSTSFSPMASISVLVYRYQGYSSGRHIARPTVSWEARSGVRVVLLRTYIFWFLSVGMMSLAVSFSDLFDRGFSSTHSIYLLHPDIRCARECISILMYLETRTTSHRTPSEAWDLLS